VSCLAFALGIALLRERERIIRSIQALVFALTTALAPVLPVAAVLFLILLPFAGLQTLWRTGHATVILLLVIGIGILLANAIVRDGAAERPAARATAWPVMALLIVMPLFTGLAFYAAGLRILQHGLTPDRFYAVVAIFVLGVYAVVYCYAVVRHKLAWGRAVPNYNPLLAAVVVAVAVLVQTPLLDPYRLSAAEQYQRLASGRADPAMFDYGFLKYRLGAPGRRALARIRTDAGTADRAVVDKQLVMLDAATDYFAWKRALDRVSLAQSVDRFGLLLDYVLVLPDGASGSSTVVARQPVPSNGVYRVRKGDNLALIARRFGVSERALVRENGIRNRNRIHVGQRLRIPGHAATTVVASTASSAGEAAGRAAAEAAGRAAAEAAVPAPKPKP